MAQFIIYDLKTKIGYLTYKRQPIYIMLL